jgi:hypothetical protein
VQFRRVSNVGLSIILCVSLAPNMACADTYRMVIQSHKDVGARCIDVPNGQFVPGMRLQMWACNNGVAQIFFYDETSQQLTIGNLCVESWGRGDPQDAVGLGSCSGQPNQRWRMVESKDYYQIIGINNRCLELRYAVKDNGAPLDMMDCDANRAQRLWSLIEAPTSAVGSASSGPASALPSLAPRVESPRAPPLENPQEAAAKVNELKRTIQAQSGVETLISYERAWDRNCNAQVTEVTITRAPQNGIVNVVLGTSIIPASTPRGGATGVCAGRQVSGNQVMYRSNPGFRGVDVVSYDVVNPNGYRGSATITINVQ